MGPSGTVTPTTRVTQLEVETRRIIHLPTLVSLSQWYVSGQNGAQQSTKYLSTPMNLSLSEAIDEENSKYAKYKNFYCSEIYDTYGKWFGYTGNSMKYVVSPTKLSQCDFDFSIDSDIEYGGDKMPINVETIDSSGSLVEGRVASPMNISGNHSGDKRKCKHKKRRGKKKMYGAREVSAFLEQMVSVGTDLASIARSYRKGIMLVGECIDELLSFGHVQETSSTSLHDGSNGTENRNSYSATKTPYLRFKFVEYCFERDKMSLLRKV